MRIRFNIFLLFLNFLGFLNFAQVVPPIVSYSTEDYQAENQNWSISQAENKFIYIANNKGLLEFNGAAWQLYPSPNQTIMRSVKVIGEKIYTGCYMEFGYWKRNNYNVLEYTSLSELLPKDLIEDEQFWNIATLGDYVLFQSFDRIYIYSTTSKKFKVIDSSSTITKMVELGGDIYFQKLDKGIFKIVNGKAELLCNNDILKSAYIVNFFQKNGKLLMLSQSNGWFSFDGTSMSAHSTPVYEKLKNVSFYTATSLENGGYALGTISNGIIIVDESGNIDYTINQEKSLSNNTVLAVFEDIDHNIWTGLDNGVDCINLSSPFRIFRDNFGKIGTVYTASLYNNKLFLGTNQGLFFREYGSNSNFSLLEKTEGQVWSLMVYDNRLFISHNKGTYILSGETLTSITQPQGTWAVQKIEGQPNFLLQGNYDGLSVLEKQNNSWGLRNKISGFDISSKYFALMQKDKIVINHEYKGVYILEVNDLLTKVKSVQIDSSLRKSYNSSLIKYDDKIIYASKDGVFSYDIELGKFKRDTTLSQFYEKDTYLSGKLVKDLVKKRIWGFTKNNITNVSQGQLSEVPNLNTITFPNEVRKMMIGYENILNLENDNYLIGTSSGYIIMDLSKFQDKDHRLSINSVQNINSSSKQTYLDFIPDVALNNQEASIAFSFSVPVYEKFQKIWYQHRLKGINANWSDWSTKPYVAYENLPFGNYVFQVRAKVNNVILERTENYSFKVLRPWYLSNMAIAIYVLSLALFSFIIHKTYTGYYRRQRLKLMQKNQKDIELRELESEQQFMQLKNQKLKQDVDGKNRELAISTMSLIRKNEFLGKVKEDLNRIENSNDKTIRKVISDIDNSINDNENWRFFQEAFNNADKDFFKKVKTLHPKLTPNDLKLCAYLRLNLTSKEIAPLLNISPRSVEVKRYRLRKKMNLEHEEGLTDYILEI